MTYDKHAVLAQIDEVLTRVGASEDRPYPAMRGEASAASRSLQGNPGEMASALVAAIERNAPHPSYVIRASELKGEGAATIQRLVGVLVSVRKDIEAGYFRTLEERVREGVFDDLLESAEHILTIHPAPAAVLAGSVLEEHVRALARAREIDLVDAKERPRSFEHLSEDLVRHGLFGQSQRKTVAAWYAQRTEAAHGHFENVIADDVPRMIAGVRDFITRHPA